VDERMAVDLLEARILGEDDRQQVSAQHAAEEDAEDSAEGDGRTPHDRTASPSTALGVQ